MVVTFTHRKGDVDDATGPIRTKRKKKATNVAFVRGDKLSFQTGTAVKATSSTHGPFGICYKDAATTDPDVEVLWNTKATIYVVCAANCLYDAYVTVDDNNKAIPFVYTGTPTVPTRLLGQLVKPGTTIYDGVQQPTTTLDNDIGGIILGFQ